ncbi:Asp23/Gls24 family envelope stress response protein [Streptomyces sp. NPDC047014]|uniref:Asp23/Gls24 family envelope stress response protein n=1 Tax=Streptomyces sp. NPDC047014 TaxID=3155736 RepID=UPI0033E80DD1
MTPPRADATTRAVAEAVLAVPGVACLRPGLRDLLRAAVPRGLSGVRVSLGPEGTVTALHVEIVVRAHHRALDVARAARTEAARAAPAPPSAVRVTVTGLV